MRSDARWTSLPRLRAAISLKAAVQLRGDEDWTAVGTTDARSSRELPLSAVSASFFGFHLKSLCSTESCETPRPVNRIRAGHVPQPEVSWGTSLQRALPIKVCGLDLSVAVRAEPASPNCGTLTSIVKIPC
jgi:hypothetical protein